MTRARHCHFVFAASSDTNADDRKADNFFSLSTLVDATRAWRAISRLDLSFAILFQWPMPVDYIRENVVPMGTKSTIMENQPRTIYKIYD